MFSATVLIGFITAIITFIWFRKSNKTKKREEEEKKRRFRSISSRFPPSQPSVSPERIQTRREKILEDTKRLLNVRRTDFNLFQGNFNQVLSNEEPPKQIITNPDTQTEEISQKPTTVNFSLKEKVETPKILPTESTKETETTETKSTPPNLFTFLKDLSFNCSSTPFGGLTDENKGGDEKPLFSSNMFDSGTTTELPSFPPMELPSTTEGYLSINTTSTTTITTTIKAKTPSFSSLPPLPSQANKKTPYDEQTLLASLVKKKGTNLKNGYKNIFTKQGTINSDDYYNNTLSPTRDEDDDDEPYLSIRHDDTDDDIIDDTTDDEENENRQIRRNQSTNDEEIDGYPPIVMVSDESVHVRKHKKESLAITRNLLNETQQFWRSFPPHSKSTENPIHIVENKDNNNNNHNNNNNNNNYNNYNNIASKEDNDMLNFEMSLRGNVDYQSHNNDGYKGVPDPYRHFLSKTDDDVELKKKAYTNIFGSAYDISLHQNVEKNTSNNVNNINNIIILNQRMGVKKRFWIYDFLHHRKMIMCLIKICQFLMIMFLFQKLIQE